MLAGSHGPCLSIRLSGEFGFGLHEPLGEESPGGGGGQHNQDVDSAVDADGQHDQDGEGEVREGGVDGEPRAAVVAGGEGSDASGDEAAEHHPEADAGGCRKDLAEVTEGFDGPGGDGAGGVVDEKIDEFKGGVGAETKLPDGHIKGGEHAGEYEADRKGEEWFSDEKNPAVVSC